MIFNPDYNPDCTCEDFEIGMKIRSCPVHDIEIKPKKKNKMTKITIDLEADDLSEQLENLATKVRESKKINKYKELSKIKKDPSFNEINKIYKDLNTEKNIEIEIQNKYSVIFENMDHWDIDEFSEVDEDMIQYSDLEVDIHSNILENEEVKKVIEDRNEKMKKIKSLIKEVSRRLKLEKSLIWKAVLD